MNHNYLLVSLLLSCLSLNHAVQAAEITANFNRQTIYVGETVSLSIQIDQQIFGSNPDLGPLEQYFEILGSSNSSRMEFVNGSRNVSTQWDITLEPKKAGAISIPGIRIASMMSNAIHLNVIDAPNARTDNKSQGEDVFIEVEVDKSTSYVQAQILFTVRLMHAIPLLDGSMGDPAPSNALVEKLSDDVNYETQRNGRSYRVIERRYAVFPERSGELVLPAVQFRGRVSDKNQRSSRFNLMMPRGRRMSTQSEPITLVIKPRPATYTGQDWLPASDLSLNDGWDRSLPKFIVGEPITRTIVLESKGLISTQLPDIAFKSLASAQIYPDQALNKSHTDGTWVYGKREQKFAIVPSQSGPLELPEIQLVWWDVISDSQKTARIPSRTIQVQAAASSALAPTLQPILTPNDNLKQPIQLLDVDPIPQNYIPGAWRWAAITFFILWISTLVIWRLSLSKKKVSSLRPPKESSSQWIKSLKIACQKNQAKEASSALIAWTNWAATGQNVTTLHQVLRFFNSAESIEAIQQLDRALYSLNDQSWQGNSFKCVLIEQPQCNNHPQPSGQRTQLQGLYSTSTS